MSRRLASLLSFFCLPRRMRGRDTRAVSAPSTNSSLVLSRVDSSILVKAHPDPLLSKTSIGPQAHTPIGPWWTLGTGPATRDNFYNWQRCVA
ncbi:hypothetical protein F4820DRAFT_81957 [Hypoxylon rubiginosum]|uniref:Uncharacterized protein n=1 Tax=Hypoxylon rubiginosum TaxID=110542 RepID=A0ACB9YPK1_9PEZI|nr:hypothetical protein F4820DRAFT_81957 [Hypoxylon rubiginosum]